MFDIDDIAYMEDRGIFEGVILHEMGHVIGVGCAQRKTQYSIDIIMLPNIAILSDIYLWSPPAY